jgi:hypothetical protein
MHSLIRILVAAVVLSMTAAVAKSAEMQTFFLPGPVELPSDKVPVDILAASLAASRAAKGESDLGAGMHVVTLAPNATVTRGVAGQPPVPKEFAVDRVNLISIVPSKLFDKGQKIFGTIDFSYRGLRTRQAFIVEYIAGASGITVGDIEVMAVTPLDHRVALFAVSATDARRIMEDTTSPYPELVDFAGKNGRALPLSGPVGDTVLVALSLDRVLAGDQLEIVLETAAGKSVSPIFLTFMRQGFPVALLPLAQQTAGKVTLVRHTDMHADNDDGRREIASVALTAAPGAVLNAPQPSAPATAQVTPSGWKLDDEANPTQLSYATPERADDPELLISCDRPNNDLHVLYRRLPSEEVEGATGKLDTLNGSITGAGATLTLPAFVSRAPEATAIGYDILLTDNSAAVLGAPDLKWRLRGMTIDAPLTSAAAQFVQACPRASTVTESMTWRRRINLPAGFAVDLPVGLFRLSSADRLGRFYRGGPGNGTLQVSTVLNQDELTPREALKRMAQDKDVVTKVTKSVAGKDSLSITGMRGSRAVFLKGILTCERSQWAFVRLEYDTQAQSEADRLAGRIDQSLAQQGAFEGQNACE